MPESTFHENDWLGQGFDASLPGTPVTPATPTTLEYHPAAAEQVAHSTLTPMPAPATRHRPPTIPGYEILGVLGRGGMGVVYQARQTSLNRIVALKVILAGAHASPDDLQRFRTEAEAVAKLSHPNIIQIYEVGLHEGMPYCALEFVGGGNLDRLLAGQPQPPRDAARLMVSLARGTHAAHTAGIVHRDLKPANILLTGVRSQESGDRKSQETGSSPTLDFCLLTPKITDFGLAKRLEAEAGQTKTGDILGTPSYMAPEQGAGRLMEIGPASDVYSLGAILYEMLTGRPPFQGLSALETVMQAMVQEVVPPSRLQPKIPRDLETICLKCLHKVASRRYPSAELLAEDLERFLHGQPILARPVGTAERVWRWCRRNPGVAGLTAALFLALAGGLTAVSVLYVQANDQRLRAEDNERQAVQDRDRADRERQRADAHLTLAKKALENSVAQVAGNPKLLQADFTALRKELLTTVQPFYEQLARREGDDPTLDAERAQAWYRLGTLRRELGDLPGVLEAMQQCQANLDKLLVQFPDRPVYRFELGNCLVARAAALDTLGRVSDAETVYHAARDLQEKLVASHPQEAEYLSALARTLNNLGGLWVRGDRVAEAVPALERVRQIYTDLLARYPKNRAYRKEMATCLTNLATLLERRGKDAEALTVLRQSTEAKEELVRAFPEDPEHRVELARAFQSIAIHHQRQNKFVEAAAAYGQSLPLREKLVTDFPANPSYRSDLAATLNNLAMTLGKLGQRQEEGERLRQALAIREKLVADFPQQPSYAVEFGGSACNQGHREMGAKRPKEALAQYDKAIAALEKALAINGQQPSARSFLSNALVGRAAALDLLQRWPEAVQAWDRVLATVPASLGMQYRLHKTMSLAQAGAHAQAFTEVEALATTRRWPGEVYLHLACVCGVAAQHATHPSPLEERYAQRALELLRQAHKAGAFKDPQRRQILQFGVDLNPLRDRPEFKQFLQESVAPTK